MRTIPLRHVGEVNPITPEFDRLPADDDVTFMPLETVWADTRIDFSRRRPKRDVTTGYTRFRSGDVLVPKVTPTFQAGRVAIAQLDTPAGAGTTELHIVRARLGVSDARFLAYVCRSKPFLDEGVSAFQGVAGLQRVPDEFLRSFPVADIPLDEQRRIADFLDTETTRLDRLLDLRRRQEESLAARHDVAVTAAVADASRGDEVVRLKYTGARITVGIVVTPAAWYVDEAAVPALRGVDVNPGTIKTDDLIQISEEGHRAHPKSRLRAGDVVVVRTGNAGAACAVPEALVGANAIDLLIIRPGGRLLPRFVEHIINSEQTRRFVDEFSVGTIQSHFNVGTLGELPIPMLRLRQQALVVKRLDALATRQAALIGAIGLQRVLLLERRQALITAAVTGRLDVTTARGAET